VRKLLAQIDKRSMGRVDLVDGKGSDWAKIKATGRKDKGEPEEVVLKATSRAIERVLNLALFFEGQGDCRVRIRTGSVGVVDDVVEVEESKKGRKRKNGGGVNDQQAAENGGGGDGDGVEAGAEGIKMAEQEQELPETRVRKTSMVEVAISLR